MFIEAIVTSIDVDKGFCRCKDIYNGGTILNVRWITPLGENPAAPEHGEQVFIAKTTGGAYWIIGGMSLASSGRRNETSMLDGLFEGTVQRNITPEALGYGNGTNPTDHIPGDAVLSGRGGSFIGALLGGVALFKASPTAQIIATKIDGFIKVFALNFQRFTDAASHEERNLGGRTFVRDEYYDTQGNARSDTPKLVSIKGDVNAGSDGTAKDERVSLTLVQTARETVPVLSEERFLDGSAIFKSQSLDETQKAVVSRTKDYWKVEVTGGQGVSTLILNTDGTVSLTSPGAMALESPASVSITTPLSTFNGDVRIEGALGVKTSVLLDNGIGLGTHSHSDPHGGNVGPPIP